LTKPLSSRQPKPAEPAKRKATLHLVTESPKRPLLLPSADSKDFAKAWRLSSTFLRACLPPNSANLYTARKYGNHIGVPCQCPRCNERPPRHIKPWNRWRWMAFHEMTEHKGFQE
jgi:hypothetical protein